MKYYYHLLSFTAAYKQNVFNLNNFSSRMTTKKRLNTLHNTVLSLGEVSKGRKGSVASSGVMLQAGKSRVRIPIRSLMFTIDLILPSAIYPWGILRL
jgi:hypothetical protein